ncbi:hypothetical protein FQR65_LT14064 [Abscondita terminalis]|nr:hypothetical protein FQR65_LT14064 [Abscondita terminalis]
MAERYMVSEDGVLLKIITNENDLPNENYINNVSWDQKCTKLLIQSYFNLKEEFRNPQIKKKLFWSKIKNIFLNNGYKIDEEALDRKWRNLKKTYTNVKDNIKSTGRGRVSWEHYEAFNNIYVEDKTVNLPKVISSTSVLPHSQLHSSTSNDEEQSHQETPSNSITTLPVSSSSSLQSPTTSRCASPGRPCTSRSKTGAYYLKKRLADIEEKRVEEI